MIEKNEGAGAANLHWPAQHTWTPVCDGLHPPGPCTESMEPLKITEVQRLRIKEGDRLIVRVNRNYLDEHEGRIVRERIRDALALAEHMPILVTTQDWEFTLASEK